MLTTSPAQSPSVQPLPAVKDSSVRPPPVMDSSVRSPPVMDSSVRPPPVIDSSVRPPPVMDSSSRPPPVMDSSVRPPPAVWHGQQNEPPLEKGRSSIGRAISAKESSLLSSDNQHPPLPSDTNPREYLEVLRHVCPDELKGKRCQDPAICTSPWKTCPDWKNGKVGFIYWLSYIS